MHQATAFYSDGLDLLAEFLASSRPSADGAAAVYADQAHWTQAMRQLGRWSRGHGELRGDRQALRIEVGAGAWNHLYAAALSAGRATAPDALGMAARGAGGMLAELSAVPLLAQALQPSSFHAAPRGDVPEAAQRNEPWLCLDWQPLRKLLLRDRLLAHEAERPRLSVETLAPDWTLTDPGALADGFLLHAPGQPPQLLCPASWQRRISAELGRHFHVSALLLLRLMFHSPGQGWGWDAESAQCRGLAELMRQAEQAGLTDFHGLGENCALLAAAIDMAAAGSAMEGELSAVSLLAQAVNRLAALWPPQMLHPRHPSAPLMAGWMAQVDDSAEVAPDALLGPGARIGAECVIESAAIVHGGAEIGPGVVIPEGVVVAPGARVARLMLEDVALPAGTVLRGSALLQRGAQVGRDVTLGADVDISVGVRLPDGIEVADRARVRILYLGRGALLPPGTKIEGSLTLGARARVGEGVRIGAGVEIGANAAIGDGLHLPRGVIVADGARLGICDIAASARVPMGTVLHGDVQLRQDTVIGLGVTLGFGVDIGPGVIVPAGVTVLAGARIDRLRLNGCHLPRQTAIGGNLILGQQCQVGRHVTFAGDNRIAAGVVLPARLHIARGARIDRLRLGTPLPPSTVVCGSLDVGANVTLGRGITLGASVILRASLPDGISVGPGATVRRCETHGALLGWDVHIDGDLYLADGVEVGNGVRFGHGVRIETPCRIPDGVTFRARARVRRLELAPDVTLPAGTRIGGDLCLGRGVRVGTGVEFGADVEIGPGVAIPDGARIVDQACISRLDIAPGVRLPDCFHLSGDAVVESGACIGDNATLGRDVEIGAGARLPPGVILCDGARLTELRLGDQVTLPAGTRIGGNLIARHGATVGIDVELGAGVDIGAYVSLPEAVQVCPGARVRVLSIAPEVLLPRATRIEGDVWIVRGARIGQSVTLGAGAWLGAKAEIPDGAIVATGAHIDRLRVASSVTLGGGVVFTGNATIMSGACVGRGVRLGKGVAIGPRVRLPDGVTVADGARVRRLCVGPGVNLPPAFMISGDLCIGQAAVVGLGAQFGASVWIAPGAVIDDHARVAAGTRVGAPPLSAGAPPADASLPVWQAYLTRVSLYRQQDPASQDRQLAQANASQHAAPGPADVQASAPSPQAPSAPIPIPGTVAFPVAPNSGLQPFSPLG